MILKLVDELKNEAPGKIVIGYFDKMKMYLSRVDQVCVHLGLFVSVRSNLKDTVFAVDADLDLFGELSGE